MDKERIIIFGTGKFSKRICSEINFDMYEIVCFLDNNIQKTNKLFIRDITIFHPSILLDQNFELVNGTEKIIILSSFYQEISSDLIENYNVQKNRIENYLYFTKNELIKYYESDPKYFMDKEVKEVISYLRSNRLQVFNYLWADDNDEIEILFDEENQLYYVMYYDHRLYFKRSFRTKEAVEVAYRALLTEQKEASPHYYFNDLKLHNDMVVLDAGTAEGNFALRIIDRVKRVIILESDAEWLEALKLTFSPFEDKVIIINKLLDRCDGKNSISLDTLYEKYGDINVVKLDIEGAETKALQGGKALFENRRIQVLACCYHYQDEEKDLKLLLERYKFDIKVNKGYMFFIWPDELKTETLNQTPRIRRGIIYGSK